MVYHNCGLCVGDSGEQRQIKRQRYGFTNSKTIRNTRWKKHRNQTTKWPNSARVIKKKQKQIKKQINEMKIMMVVERLGVRQNEAAASSNGRCSLSPWVCWSLLGWWGRGGSDWRWICWEKLLEMKAETSGLCSGSLPSLEWFPLGGWTSLAAPHWSCL